uniref:Bactericidal permeability-increasing protein n=1 Tax=Panagrellus redivivus TaxID=6233 RepID=A0A7E4V788_PANRE
MSLDGCDRNCILDADLAGLDLAMNRRSWTMLLDFFGALGEKPPPPGSKTPPEYNPDASLGALDEKYLELLYGAGKVPPEMLAKIAAAVAHPHKAAKKDDFQMHLRFNVAAARVHMTYPKNQSQLGLVILNGAVLDLRLNVKNVAEPMLMSIATSELFIHDATPFYSRMYSERVAFKANPAHGRSSESDEGKKIEINILKYRTNDPELKRDCDMRFRIIAPDTAKLHYVHTHRFFCAIMDFWMHFAELQDQVRRVNEMVSDCEDGQKARVFVDINFPGGVSLVLPLNQFSEQIILFDMATLKVSNKFQLASLTPEFNEQCVELNMNEDKYDCLLENMSVVCGGCLIHEGYRVSVDGPPKDFVSDVFLKHIGQGNFQNYYFAVMEKAILSRRYDLKIGVYRNLSALISHSAPDLTVLTQFEDIDLHFSSDFYCLMRGFLEKNLGEMLIPVPETVPIEVLENPERGFAVAIAFKYITLSFRLSFHNVHFHFLVPENPKIVAPGKFKKFGRMVLHKARISFDCYIDSLSEFDLICESTDLIDTRFEGGDKDAENVFPVILAPRNRNSTANSKNSMMKLMSEAHIMMKKDEAPVVTLVLQNSRIVLILDWLNNAKDFFLLNSTFVPPEEPTNTKHACAFSAPKDGVLTRSRSSVNLRPLHTVTLKITLRESDLILLEQPKDSSSLALVCFTTAVLNLHDQHGVFEGDFEVQRLNLSWCVMSSENSTRCQLSNDFTVTMTVQRDIPAVSASEQASALFEASKSGLGSVPAVAGLPKQKLNFELDEAIVRLSYKDLLVAKCVLEGSINRLTSSFANSVIPKRGEQPGRPPFIFENAFFNAASFCVWFLDDSQGVALPMMRLLLNDVHAEHQVGKATNPEHRVSENINAKLSIGMDYFNQRVFGWEPFIEPWNIDEFSVSWKGNFLNIRLRTEPSSPLDINLTQTLVQQMKHFLSKWAAIKKSLDRDFRNLCIRSRADHLPYLMRNDTGANLLFTTNVEEVVKARNEQRKPTAKWFTTTAGKSCTFEFPTKRLISGDKANELRQLIVRVDGWDEISPVDVDSVGTYFRVTKMTTSKRDPPRARVVVAVTMEPDGRKVVTIRSALVAINELPDAITLRLNNRAITNTNETTDIKLEPGAKQPIPLRFVNAEMEIILNSIGHPINWRAAKQPGDIVNTMIKYADKIGERAFWMCVSIKREHYPEYESVSGHTIVFTSPLTLLNLLPVEIEFSVGDNLKYSVGAGKRLKIMPIDLHHPLSLTVRSEQFRTVKPVIIHRAQFAERPSHDDKRISLPMIDGRGRPLDMYGSVYLTRGGGLHLSFWVPYWIVNRSGIPLIIKQEATEHDAAGQITDHEKAKDRAPLMFSFVDNCPQNCVVRVGRQFERDREYKPKFCKKFPLSAGVQALKLLLEHEQQATLMYDIGVEVRQCTGRYKDTQVVLFTPRYRLYNQSTTQLFVCHQEDVGHPSKHVPLAPKCNLIWHENFEDKRQLCIRRADVAHWSCPFRLDQIGSFHLTMRSQDDTPKFVRVEVALSGASFWVTFTDSVYFPAPIKIQNLSDVPVLYQQASKEHNHYRTICKANSTVEYSWDNLYGEKLLTLQVYENKSHSYDPSKPKRGPPLVYENYLYIRYAPSFAPARATDDKRTEDHDLVMEARVNGKVVLTPMNVADSSQRQLWRMASDGALENVGLNHTSDPGVRRVLDVLDKEGFALMVCPRRGERDVTQRWRFTNDDRLACGIDDMYVEAVSKNRLILAEEPSTNAVVSMTSEGVPIAQQFTMQHQKPGSGMLDVECLHVGPTLVVRITDHWDELAGTTSMPIANSLRSRQSRSRTRSPQSLQSPTQSIRTAGSRRRSRPRETHDSFSIAQEIPWNFNAELSLPSGIGVSLVNRNHEELVYMRLQGVQVDVSRIESTYQLTGHVNVIQADNQLLMTDRWHVLYCQVNCLKGAYVDGPDTPNSSSSSTSFIDLHTPLRPALKLEMNCTPMEHYDAFDCFRVKLCDMCVLLDETLLWKLVQFMQETDATEVVSTSSMVLPPNIEPDMSVPGAHSPDGTPTRRCYFGTLDLEVGNVALTAVTVAKNGLPKDLQLLKRQFNIKLVSFENALVSLPPFRQFHYFETMKFLVESLSNFYMLVLQNQTYNIVVSMDAFGNPRGLVTDVKESFQGLVFEGDISGFVYGLGYGVTKSLSKVASSMSHGVGSLTFDDQHELMRRRMLRMQPASNDGGSAAFSHLCNGVKGLGVGIVGGLTAIMGNSVKGAKKDGLTGLVKGVATGAVDTVTKPAQGFFDLLDGTASALKEVVGSQQLRKSRFAEYRVRLPRVGTNLQSLLPPYSEDLAEAQQELLRINSYSTNETLLDVEVILRHQSNGNRVEQRLLICSEQCLCLKQINDDPATVSQRIIYRYFKNIYVDVTANLGHGLVLICVAYDPTQRPPAPPKLYCGDAETARRICEKVLRAKQLYDHSKRTLAVSEDFDANGVNY